MNAPKSEDAAARDTVEGHVSSGDAGKTSKPSQPAPHAKPSLVNPEATPGAGALPTPGEDDGLESTSG